jgi:hypothetical protein
MQIRPEALPLEPPYSVYVFENSRIYDYHIRLDIRQPHSFPTKEQENFSSNLNMLFSSGARGSVVG